MNLKWTTAICAGLFLGCLQAGDLTVNQLFASNAVLQQEKKVPVWGTGKPGQDVEVRFKGQTVKGKVGSDGKWRVDLAPMKADSKAAVMTVLSGGEKKVIYNLLVGEVWILYGQSHMSMTWGGKVSELKAADKRTLTPEVQQALLAEANKTLTETPADPLHRCAKVWLNTTVSWFALNPKTMSSFAMMGYQMGEILRKELNVPVGIINMARGCSSLESWLPEEEFTLPSLQEEKKKIKPFVDFYRAHEAKKLSAQEIADGYTRYCNEMPNLKSCLKDGKADPKSYSWIWQYVRVVAPTGNYENATRHLMPFAVRGMIWWQGETNYKTNNQDCDKKLKLLFECYRRLWEDPSMPMLVVLQGQRQQYAGLYSRFREQQFRAVNTIPNTFMVNNLSTPPEEVRMIHPYHDKIQIGKDAAALALSRFYGKTGKDGSGPLFDSVRFQGAEAEVSFRFGKGLAIRGGKAVGFELAGADRKFHPAEAVIRDGKAVVTSKQVPAPQYVRYMWEDTTHVPCLINGEGLTAFPFDTSLEFFRQGNKINAK